MYAVPERVGEEGRASSAPRRPEPAPPLDVVVQLQQAHGNQAVARMLGQRRLARFGVRVVMDPAAAAPAITDIHVMGRPKLRLIAGAEGSHVTAWAVFADIVRRQLVGQGLDGALALAIGLLQTQQQALRAAWPGAVPQPVTDGLAAATAVLASNPASQAGRLSKLQEVIASYLTLHNLRPATAVQLGKGQAIGAGEPTKLSTLRNYEVTGVEQPQVLYDAFFGLIDSRALQFIDDLAAPSANAPGVNPQDPNRVSTAVRRGLEDLNTAYPRAYAAVVTSANVVTQWMQSKQLPPLQGAVPAAAQAPAAAQPGWSRTGATAATEVGKRDSTCQIVLGPPPPGRVGAHVQTLKMAGRPRTLTKAYQGHHTVAWKLEMLRLEKLMIGNPLPYACARLAEICNEVLDDLNTGIAWLEAEMLDGIDEPFRDYSRIALVDAYEDLRIQEAAFDPGAGDPFALLLKAQDLIAAWMRGVNVLPLGSADIGAPANSRGEGQAIASLRAFENAPRAAGRHKRGRAEMEAAGAARGQLLKLLDTKAMLYLHAAAPSGFAYPGRRDERVAVIMRRFLRAATTVFPKTVVETGLDTDDGLREFLQRLPTRFANLDALVQDILYPEADAEEGDDMDAEALAILQQDDGEPPAAKKQRVT